jgi:hypothetical protein
VASDEVVQAAIEASGVVVECRRRKFCHGHQIRGEGAQVQLHVFEGSAANAPAAGAAGERVDGLLVGVVFAVAGEGACAAVEEGACCEVALPFWPVPVSGFVSMVSVGQWTRIHSREVSGIITLFSQGCFPEPEVMAVPWEEQSAVVNLEGVIDMCAIEISALNAACERRTYATKSSSRFRTPGYSSLGRCWGFFCMQSTASVYSIRSAGDNSPLKDVSL